MSLTEVVLTLAVAAVVAGAMEPWSRFVHARLWHGALYAVHRTHHPEAPARRWLEANDLFSLVHAAPAALALALGVGVLDGLASVVALGIGLGLCGFGLAYMVVHDGLVHRRLPVGFLRRWRFFRRVAAAHEVHHRTGGAPFGLFLGPRELRRARRRAAGSPVASEEAPGR